MLRSPRQTPILGVLVVLTVTPLTAAAKEVVVRGEAPVTSTGPAAAEKAALEDALARAVARVVGVAVQHELSTEQRETTKDGRTAFESRASVLLLARSRGYVRRHEVLATDRDEARVRVEVRVDVFESKVAADRDELRALLALAGHPTVALELDETLHSDEKTDLRGRVAAKLEAELLRRGFVIVPAERAEIRIFGEIVVHDRGVVENAAGLAAPEGMRRLELVATLKASSRRTGTRLAAESVSALSIGTTVDRALHRALEGRGRNFVVKVVDALLPSLEVTLAAPERNASQAKRLRQSD